MGKAKKKQKHAPAWQQPDRRAVEVDNPDWRPDLDGEKAFPRKTAAIINIRESAVEMLFSRGVLSKLQKKAADEFRSHYEAFSAESVRAIDYSRDQVDGGGVRTPVSQAHIRARRELGRCRAELGSIIYPLIVSVCGQGRQLADIFPFTGDAKRDAHQQRQRLTAADNLRAGLDALAVLWGLASKVRKGEQRKEKKLVSVDSR